jgi:transcriptional regulator with PAS, ATPase and Fis domain
LPLLRDKSLKQVLQEKAEAIAFALRAQVLICDVEEEIVARGQTSEISGPQWSTEYDYSVPILYQGKPIGFLQVFLEKGGEFRQAEMLNKYLMQEASLLGQMAVDPASAKRVKELAAILETVHEGALVINCAGIVTYCNAVARKLLRREKSDLVGIPIGDFWPEAAALKSMDQGVEFTEQEEMCSRGRDRLHFIVTLRLLREAGEVNGAVISFRDIAEARRLIYLMHEDRCGFTFEDIIGCSPAIEEAKRKAGMVSGSSSTVLISGETGVGKEVFARAIHYGGPRAGGPFIYVNCGAIPENLLESELFGYEGGAFTGALKGGKAGKFELADKGTIFLDEIGDMPLGLQVKLLHVLQSREVERVGGTKQISVDIRVIAASNRDLEAMMEEKNFRKDLYFRLGVIPLHVPPLRERKEDIPLLIEHCLQKFIHALGKGQLTLSAEVLDCLICYAWPGNVREMENVLEYAVNMCQGREIKLMHLPERLAPGESQSRAIAPLDELVQDFERKILEEYVQQYGTTLQAKQEIAKMLGISRATLYRKLSTMGIK